MIRILHVVRPMNFGGIETFIMNIYRILDKDAIQFDFLVLGKGKGAYDDEIISMGGIIYNLDNHRTIGIGNSTKQFKKFLDSHIEYPILHFHISSLTTIFYYIKIAKLHSNRKIILHSHSTFLKGLKIKLIFHFFYRMQIHHYGDYFFACSEKAGKWMYNNKIYSNKLIIVKNGIDVNRYIFQKEVRSKYKRELSLENKIVIGHVGSFIPVKNHEFLIEVFYHLLDLNQKLVLLLIGIGPELGKIKERINELNISDKVLFLGQRKDINNLMQAMDMFIMPSKFEGIPLTLIEAQTAGLKIYASNKVDNSANITNLISYYPLTITPKEWAKKIIIDYKPFPRESFIEKVCNKGYDIRAIKNQLTVFYKKC